MGRQEEIVNERLRKLKELRAQKINPYPDKYETTHTSAELQEKYKSLKNGSKKADKVKVAGRLMSIRDLGKINFSVIQDGHGKIQVVLQDKETPSEVMKFFSKYADSGDFFGFEGTIWRTDRGELSVLVKKAILLTKSILPLPDKWQGLQDSEEKLRKRYLDILMDENVKNIFIRKSKFWNSIRSFLLEKGFLEVETPVLENSAGGAAATPFATHHNSLDLEVYLRISMGELWQKKLMVAGYPKTFEIGRQFRNEGMDAEHLQDYSQMEFYWAYANYEDGMSIVEEMYKKIAKEVYGKTKFDINGHKVDLGVKWKRIDYADTIKKETGIDIFKASEAELKKKLDSLKVEYTRAGNKARLIDSLWKYCRRKITGPVFLNGQPVDVSPLAKRDPEDARKVEQFQVIVAGTELGNGYSELNDPFDQEERFKEQQEMKEAGDAEAQSHDFEFVEALKYGMPPTCGFGVSERLFSFLEGRPIRETVIFPLMKPKDSPINEKYSGKQSSQENPHDLPISRDEAWQLVKKYNKDKSDLNHYLESEAVMMGVARKLGKNQDYWGMLGLVHDIDWGITKDNSEEHLTKAPKILKDAGFSDYFIQVVLSHGYGFDCAGLLDKKRSEELEYALACSETVTGLIHAYARMKPIEQMDVSGLKKKFKDKKFAAAVRREIIEECQNIGLSLDEFLQIAIDAIKSIAHEVDLSSSQNKEEKNGRPDNKK